MRELNLCAATLFGLLTLCGLIVLIASDNARYDNPLIVVEAVCAALFFYFLHGWHRARTRRSKRMRAPR